jgi:hypothetical protein
VGTIQGINPVQEKNNMTNETNTAVLESVKVKTDSVSLKAFNPLDVLNERQRIALAAKWGALKQAERDAYVEFSSTGITDSATLYVIASILTEANNKIFSDSRGEYLGIMQQWYQSLTSSEASIKNYGETELTKLGDKTTGAQQLTLLSALKAKLLANRTFLPEPVEKSFRALCRHYGFDLNMVK